MKLLKLNVSKIILAAAAVMLPLSASFACSDLRYITIHNQSGADLATWVRNQCACFSQNQFDTSGRYTFVYGSKL